MIEVSMSEKHYIIKGGVLTGFSDDLDLIRTDMDIVSKRRVSRIVPNNLVLRCLFYLIRSCTSDSTRIAGWTRRWNCAWVVVINSFEYGPFMDRSNAIYFEKDLLYRKGILFSAIPE